MNQKGISPLLLMMIITDMLVMLKVIQLLLLTSENRFISACGVETGTSKLLRILTDVMPLSGKKLVNTTVICIICG